MPRQLLCVWHLLKAHWLWVWQATHEITKDDRPHLQDLFKALVYAESDAEYDEAKAALEEDEIVAKYLQYLRHLLLPPALGVVHLRADTGVADGSDKMISIH